MEKPCRSVALLGLLTLVSATSTWSQTLIPSGLEPGQTYRLAMLTSSTRDASSTDIVDYNGFAQTLAANAGLDSIYGQATTWKVIGSTATVDAIDNVGAFSSPIYNLANELVANDTADLFDGNLGGLINIDENGVVAPNIGEQLVFTGTKTDGTARVGTELGAPADESRVGDNKFATSFWIDAKSSSSANRWQFYAVSSELVVPAFCDQRSVDGSIISDRTEEACGSLEVGPGLTITSGSALEAYAGEVVRLENGVTVETGATLSVDLCGQDLCAVGPAFPVCSPCVEAVCNANADCCSTAWSQSCVDLLYDSCGFVCRP